MRQRRERNRNMKEEEKVIRKNRKKGGDGIGGKKF
jgi:hypothetical protein